MLQRSSLNRIIFVQVVWFLFFVSFDLTVKQKHFFRLLKNLQLADHYLPYISLKKTFVRDSTSHKTRLWTGLRRFRKYIVTVSYIAVLCIKSGRDQNREEITRHILHHRLSVLPERILLPKIFNILTSLCELY